MTDREAYRIKYSKIATERMKNDQCPSCGKPKKEWTRRTDWRCCSVECTKIFDKEHDQSLNWDWVRSRIFKRDNYICAMCGERFAIVAKHPDFKGEEYADSSQLICDHIVPLAMDGAMWDMDNLQTLCIECNKIKTAIDLKNIAEYKKIKDKKSKHHTFKDVYTKNKILHKTYSKVYILKVLQLRKP